MLQRFIDTFTRAVALEMESMRRRLGPYEISLIRGELLEADRDRSRFIYAFRMQSTDEKLVAGSECNLVTERSDDLVTVTSLDGDGIVLTASRSIDLAAGGATLVIYPWFLYQRLVQALRALQTPDFQTDTALMLFGKGPARPLAVEGRDDELPDSLNESQRRAVALCRQTAPAFVWGPPGTGKTTTLAHVILSLLRLGQRMLVTSTTNAAVDQALAALARLDEGQAAIDQGLVVRLGQTQADTHGARLHEVLDRLNAETRRRVSALERRQQVVVSRLAVGRSLLADVNAHATPAQMGLFVADALSTVDPERFTRLFPAAPARRLATQGAAAQVTAIEGRLARLERTIRVCGERILELRGRLRQREGAVVADARVVLATMTSVYMNPLMEGLRFDAVIVEEAGMAVLPTLFYCACLAAPRAIMVGDPRQLPPIVQSPDPFVQRVMGRSIFEVTVPAPERSDLVVMLDTQYRMHASIGDLVGGTFYGGRLRHGDSTGDTEIIAAREPCPGAALVVVDTAGSATCETPEGSYSRYNDRQAGLAVEMARQAVEAGATSVAIIAPYVEQVRRIGRLVEADPALAAFVECRTVHRLQGGERDVVVFDTVDAEPLPPGRLLSDRTTSSVASNLLNVSLSRARGKLVILADVPYFRRHDPEGILSQVLVEAQTLGTVLRWDATRPVPRS